MSRLILPTRKPRKDALYSREEMQVISKYKEEYKEQTTQALRAHVLKNKILVDIFNYWDDIGNIPTNEEDISDRVKVRSR